MTAPARLPAELADLLDATLGPGGTPGVLADWFDERSADWAPVAAAVRAGAPFGPDGGYSYHPPRYLVAADAVLVWLTRAQLGYRYGDPRPPAELVLGFHRATPGREAAWRLVLPPAAYPKASRRRLWELFGVPADPAE